MTKKPQRVIINIVYAPQKGPPHRVYENSKGTIWRSKTYDKNKINVGMGWYSIRDPKNKMDSLLVVEPFCVLPRDYDVNFGEKFKYIFTWASKAFSHPKTKRKVVEINHPSCWGIGKPQSIGKDWLSWDKRRDEVMFVANNKTSTHDSQLYSLRIMLADELHKNSRFKVSWYGQIPLQRPYYRGELGNKIANLKQVKFSVCTENSYDPIYTHNYFTEKLPHVWMAGAVPLYMGCYNIDSFGFPKWSYMDLRQCIKKGRANKMHLEKEEFKKIMRRMHYFSKDSYINYSNKLKSEIIHSGKLHKAISFYRMYDTIIDKYFTEPTSVVASSSTRRTNKSK